MPRTWTAPGLNAASLRALMLILDPDACPTTAEVDRIIAMGSMRPPVKDERRRPDPNPKEETLWQD